MITDEKAIKYVRKLKKYCEEQGSKLGSCYGCIFHRSTKNNSCPIYEPIGNLKRVDGTPL